MFFMKNKILLIIVFACELCMACKPYIVWPLEVDHKVISFPSVESADTIKSMDGNCLCLSEVYEDGERVVGHPLYYPDNENITGLGGEWLEAYYGAEVGLSIFDVVVRVKENVEGKARKGTVVLGDGTGKRRCKIKVTQQGGWLAPASRCI